MVVAADQIDGRRVDPGTGQFAPRHGEVMATGRADPSRSRRPDDDAVGTCRHLTIDRASEHGGEVADDLHQHIGSCPARVVDRLLARHLARLVAWRVRRHADVLEPCVALQAQGRPSGHRDGRAAGAEPPQHHSRGHRDRAGIAGVAELHDVAGRGVVEQWLQRQDRLCRRLEQRVRRVDVDEFDPERPDRGDRGGAGVVRDRSSIGLDQQAVLVVPERDGELGRSRVDGRDRDHAP